MFRLKHRHSCPTDIIYDDVFEIRKKKLKPKN